MMDFELKLSKPNKKGAWIEGSVMGISYLLGKRQPSLQDFSLRMLIPTQGACYQ